MLPSIMSLTLLAAAPIIPIRGVFFPVWILCALAAVLAVAAIRAVVIALHDGPVPGLGASFYTALGVLIGIGSYMILVGGL